MKEDADEDSTNYIIIKSKLDVGINTSFLAFISK